MAPIGILVFFAFAVVGVVPAPGVHTRMCNVCHGVTDPSMCTQIHKCHGDEFCFTDVRYYLGKNYFFKGCRNMHDCPANSNSPPVGKRGNHLPPEHELQAVCVDCCDVSQCNIQSAVCDPYMHGPTTIALATTGVPTTQAPTTTIVPLPSCRDHEEDGFNCTIYDQYNFCTVTDTTSLSYDIAHNKCPKHCGFCSMTTTAPPPPTTTVPCVDHEEDGFKCTDYDQYNFCTDTASIAYTLAHQKCPKHCNFCQAGQAVTTIGNSTSQATMTSTQLAAVTQTTTTQVVTAAAVTLLVSQASSSTKPCVDFEDASFSCASWASNGFCSSPTGVLHEITVMRCSKYCGLC